MRFFRRRSAGSADTSGDSRDAALAEARRAVASLRREKVKADRRRASKQADPAGTGPDGIGID